MVDADQRRNIFEQALDEPLGDALPAPPFSKDLLARVRAAALRPAMGRVRRGRHVGLQVRDRRLRPGIVDADVSREGRMRHDLLHQNPGHSKR